MYLRAWTEIDLAALTANYRRLRALLPAETSLTAVVKANAYGHGAAAVAACLQRLGVGSFAVATLEEALSLREAGIGGNILILGYTPPADAAWLRQYRLQTTVVDAAHGRALARTQLGLPVQLAVDTGMHRLGVDYRDTAALDALLRLPSLRVAGVYSHLAAAERRDAAAVRFTEQQIAAFRLACSHLETLGHRLPPLHLQSSYGVLHYPALRYAYARIGLALYGATAPGGAAAALCPVLSLRSRIVTLHELAAGESVGYDCAFVAARPCRIAVVSLGYADGLPRGLGEGRGHALLRGRRVPFVGRVCMDHAFLDVSAVAAAAPGDIVTIIGCDGSERLHPYDVAAAAGMIPNDLLSGMHVRENRLSSAAAPAQPTDRGKNAPAAVTASV